MSYFSEWETAIQGSGMANESEYQAFVQNYYDVETEAYSQILANYPEIPQGTAADLAKELGFKNDMVTFVGFLDGLNEALKQTLELEEIADETSVKLELDFEKLYIKMHEAKADWLYNLETWDKVLSAARREELAKDWRRSKIAVSNKVGRNDPCPCGSGKKYKVCCGRA
jgi:hypothetical protein